MRTRAGALLIAMGFVGACKPPCTHCPNVAGSYLESSTPATNTCNGDSITWSGDTNAPLTLTQNGSQLTLSENNGVQTTTLTGTLYEDNSAQFGPSDYTPLDETSMEDITDGATLELVGSFHPGGNPTFTGTWEFEIVNDYGCTAKSPSTWAPAN